MIPLIIVGAGGAGREVAWLVEDINLDRPTYEFLGFLDDSATETVEGYPILGDVATWLKNPDRRVHVVCAVGSSFSRFRLVQRLTDVGVQFATLIHPSVHYSRWVEFGPGTIVRANNSLTTNVSVGAHCLLSTGCTVGHDTRLEDFVSLMPGVNISGDVVCGTGSYFGTGSAVINGVSVGAWTVVGAGGIVTRDLPPGVVAVGVPAKPIKDNPHVPEDSQPNQRSFV